MKYKRCGIETSDFINYTFYKVFGNNDIEVTVTKPLVFYSLKDMRAFYETEIQKLILQICW